MFEEADIIDIIMSANIALSKSIAKSLGGQIVINWQFKQNEKAALSLDLLSCLSRLGRRRFCFCRHLCRILRGLRRQRSRHFR